MAVPKGESLYIYGLHDRGGEHLMMVNGQAKGWVLVTEELRANPVDQGGSNYQDLADRGFGVIVRLNHAYGPDGTIPHSSQYQNFARRVANFVNNSPGAHIWLIGNEMNFEREQPRKQPGAREAEPITPRRYATCYRLCREAIHRLPGHAQDQVIVGAIGPWNAQTPYEADPEGKYPANKISGAPHEYPYHGFFGDYIHYLRDILLAIGPENCDGIAIHAYSHGYDPALVFSEGKMDWPFANYHYHFRTYQDQMAIIPQAFRHLPVYLTEANGDEDPGGIKWPDVNRGWIKNAYKEINDWNKAGNQQIRSVILYRWSRDDTWHISGKGQVQQDFQEAIARNYQWDPTVQPEGEAVAERPPYRTRYLSHNTPTSMPASQTLTVNITVQNTGRLTWVRGGSNPFRLGFQWYTMDGRMVSFPPQLDFRTPLPADVPPDGTVTLAVRLRTPATAGTYHLRWDMIHELVTWFTTQGDDGLLITPVTITPAKEEPGPPPSIQIQDVSADLAHHPAKQYPTRSLAAIRRLIIHHTATPATVSVERIATYHVNNLDLAGITYHYCIDQTGQIFQTQPLTTVSTHAGKYSGESVGVCLIGNFSETPPPQAQLDAAAALLAQLVIQLNLSVEQIYGYSELVVTASPGATWPTWKEPLLAQVRSLVAAEAPEPEPSPEPEPEPTPEPPPAEKPIPHYLLLWHRGPDDWAKWDLLGAFEYIGQFAVTIGFSVEEAKSAQYVTIVGGPDGVPTEAEQILRAAGCRVERLAGATEAETRQILDQLAARGERFRSF